MGELLTGAFDLYRRNARLVLAVTVPVIVVVTGLTALGLGELGARYKPSPPLRDTYIALAANQLVTVPLISSILARWVLLMRRSVVLALLVAGVVGALGALAGLPTN